MSNDVFIAIGLLVAAIIMLVLFVGKTRGWFESDALRALYLLIGSVITALCGISMYPIEEAGSYMSLYLAVGIVLFYVFIY